MNFFKTVWALAIGVVTIPTGKTMFDWSIYDHPESVEKPAVFLTDRGFLLYASKNTFEVGDLIETIRHNDTQRKLNERVKIIDMAICIPEEVITMLFKNGYDYRPKRPFQKAKFNRKLSTSYSVKGTM